MPIMTVRRWLEQKLPAILPEWPDAINGTEIFERLGYEPGGPLYQQASVRYGLTTMSVDSSTCIAKNPDGHGYYLRPHEQRSVKYSTGAAAVEAAAYELARAVVRPMAADIMTIELALRHLRDADKARFAREVGE